MVDIAVFKFDSLPDIAFTVRRTTDPDRENETGQVGNLSFEAHRELPEVLAGAGRNGRVGPEMDAGPSVR